MGKCKYCNKSAGIFNNKHKECEAAYKEGRNAIFHDIITTISSEEDYPQLQDRVTTLAAKSFVKQHEVEELYGFSYDKCIDNFLDDGVLSEMEEKRLLRFNKHFNLPHEVLNKTGSLDKVVKASILRELMNGTISTGRQKVAFALPFNFQKAEELVWLFQHVEFYEQRIRTTYQGGYSGVSIRVAKGVYYKTGGFRGNPVRTAEMVPIAMGLLALTNKHIYFHSPQKSFRIRYDKVVAYDHYSNALGVQKDGVTAKPQVFSNLDGWFAYNFVQNIAAAEQ